MNSTLMVELAPIYSWLSSPQQSQQVKYWKFTLNALVGAAATADCLQSCEKALGKRLSKLHACVLMTSALNRYKFPLSFV